MTPCRKLMDRKRCKMLFPHLRKQKVEVFCGMWIPRNSFCRISGNHFLIFFSDFLQLIMFSFFSCVLNFCYTWTSQGRALVRQRKRTFALGSQNLSQYGCTQPVWSCIFECCLLCRFLLQSQMDQSLVETESSKGIDWWKSKNCREGQGRLISVLVALLSSILCRIFASPNAHIAGDWTRSDFTGTMHL